MLTSIAGLLGIQSAEGHAVLIRGWSSRSLVRSLQIVMLLGAVGWQFFMAIVIYMDLGRTEWDLILGQVAVGIGAILAIRSRAFAWTVPVGMMSLGSASFVVSGDFVSATVFAACWQVNLVPALLVALVLRRRVFAWGALLTAFGAVVLLTALPQWGLQFVVGYTITQVSILLAVRLGIGILLTLAANVDRESAVLELTHVKDALAGESRSRVAEEARLLHDTAINTLGAIATTAIWVNDSAVVRVQCRRDIELLADLTAANPVSTTDSLVGIYDFSGSNIAWLGVDRAELAAIDRELDDPRGAAAINSVREALMNAFKHAESSNIQVKVTRDSQTLRFEVHDDGIGLDSLAAIGRGIQHSILDRARDYGFRAEITSELGAGTTVTIEIPKSRPEPKSNILEFIAPTMSAFRTSAGITWGAGVTVVGLLLMIAGATNAGNALVPMLSVMSVAVAVSIFAFFANSRHFAAVFLIVCVLVVFYLSAAANGFGVLGGAHWQALAPTGPFVLLVASQVHRAYVWTAAGAWLAVVATMMSGVYVPNEYSPTMIFIAGFTGGMFSLGWVLFQSLAARVSAQEAVNDQVRIRDQAREDFAKNVQESFRRWVDAGLESAIELMRRIEAGELPIDAPETRAACAREEKYLRQLVSISPRLTFLGSEMMPVLRTARAQGVDLDLRLGAVDAPDKATAEAIGSVVKVNVETAQAGEKLTVSVFDVADGVHLTMTGASLQDHGALGPTANHFRLGDLDVLELTYTRNDEVAAHANA